jgi:hypothetical protein
MLGHRIDRHQGSCPGVDQGRVIAGPDLAFSYRTEELGEALGEVVLRRTDECAI